MPSVNMLERSTALSMKVAYANKEELSGNVSDISRDGYQLAQDISSYSLIAVSKYAQPFLAPNSGIVSMTYLGFRARNPEL